MEVPNPPQVVYLFLVSYGRSKPDQIHLVIPNFLQVRILGSNNYHTTLTLLRTAMTEVLSYEH
jgi:hypothetical protein